MLAGGSIIFFTYIGFDAVSTASEECKNPQRDVPIGIIATLVVCTILYVGVAAGAHRHRPLVYHFAGRRRARLSTRSSAFRSSPAATNCTLCGSSFSSAPFWA